MEKHKIDVAIAGLLHDIGKLVQRSRDDPWKKPEGYEDEGQPVHALWSGYFIKHNIPQDFRAAALHAIYHHQPDKSPAADHSISTLIAVADKLSAGERADEQPDAQGSDLPQQMVSIFDRVGAYRTDPKIDHHYLLLKRLNLTQEAIFPRQVMAKKDRTAAYEALSSEMISTASKEISDPETYLESLTADLELATWCVPSAFYHNLPDVSLYDHSRMTAALAVCLSDKAPSHLDAMLDALRNEFAGKASPDQQKLLDSPAALLIGGDISGIQKFIYMLSSKQAAKTLRGRSLYLQLLTEAVLRFVLREMGIPRVNVIYSGGGHFYLLAPLSAAEKISEIQNSITRVLLKHHGTSLYLALASTEIPANGFKLGQFPLYWNRMHGALAQAKQRRYSELGAELYQKVFQPVPHGGNREKTCSVCGEEKEAVTLLKEPTDPTIEAGDRICPLCDSFNNPLGKYLTQSSFILLELGAPEARPVGTALDVLAEFGMGVKLLDSSGKQFGQTLELKQPVRGVLWAINDTVRWPETGSLPTARITHFLVNHVPEATFDDLQKKANGIHRLGVLRMDVDNLGSIFKDGFGKGEKSITTVARLSTLSFQMSLFFDGWVKRICEQESENIYAVYSGGDDLFLIAPWDIVPGLAARIAADFKEYTSGNPDMHISGGMAFIHGKYPVYQAAADAAIALDLAKDEEGKNAFHFLGAPWTWKDFHGLTEKFNLLVQSNKDHNAPANLLQLLQKLALMDAEHKKSRNKKSIWGRWFWLGDYQFKRMIEKAKGNEALAADLSRIHNDLTPFYENIAEWGKAARWAQIYLRKSTQKEGDQE